MDLKSYLQGQADQAQSAVQQYDADLQAKHAEGVEVGRGQIQLPDPNDPNAQYTQAQANQMVNDAVANATGPLQAHVDQLTADLERAKEKGAADLAALKAEVVAKIRNANIDDLALAEELEKPVEPTSPAPPQEPVEPELPVEEPVEPPVEAPVEEPAPVDPAPVEEPPVETPVEEPAPIPGGAIEEPPVEAPAEGTEEEEEEEEEPTNSILSRRGRR